ncbi:MAG: MFS transporter, partial [Parafilimonas terrae]|nr:MFS transporter [Parafilimonas terrae]
GSVNAVQGVGGALSGWFGGLSYSLFGWTGAFLALGVPALFALGLVIWLDATPEPGRRRKRRERRSAAMQEA